MLYFSYIFKIKIVHSPEDFCSTTQQEKKSLKILGLYIYYIKFSLQRETNRFKMLIKIEQINLKSNCGLNTFWNLFK